jgi:hypothetical protein
MILRRAALIAAGLAMTAGVGLAGVSTASAASPQTLHLTTGPWTLNVKGGGCEILSFTFTGNTSGGFTADFAGDSGVWAGGGNAVALSWTAGGDTGLLFSGSLVSSSPVTYKGSFGGTGAGLHGKLTKGAKAGC